jgi:hypothetical protein
MILSSTSDLLRLTTSSTSALDVHVSWTDFTSSSATAGRTNTLISTATTTTIVASPAASTQRLVKMFSARNRGTAAQTVTVLHSDGTNIPEVHKVTLSAGDVLLYKDERFSVQDSSGRDKQVTPQVSGITGREVSFLKVGTAKEASGVWYSYHKDTGIPGAWVPGTPGLAGRVTDGMTTTDAGCLPLWTPTGSLYLTASYILPSVAETVMIADVLWVNSGLVVTTTTAQTVNSVTLPARDLNGSTNGEGVAIGIIVTTATTNAAAITNMTVSYTNSDGTAGRTATLASFAATSVVGSFYIFQLASGDKGVRSIQSVTLGTSLVTGAVSLVMYKPAKLMGSALANTASPPFFQGNPGSRLYTGSCLLPFGVTGVTTAGTIIGSITVVEQ